MIRITNKMINITIRINNTIRTRTMIKAKLTTINLKTRTMIKITIKTTIKITTNMGLITSNKITTSRITIIITMMLTTKTITIIKTSTINSTLKKTNMRNGNRASKTPHPKKRRSTDKSFKVFTRAMMKTQHHTSKTRVMIFSIWTLEWNQGHKNRKVRMTFSILLLTILNHKLVISPSHINSLLNNRAITPTSHSLTHL